MGKILERAANFIVNESPPSLLLSLQVSKHYRDSTVLNAYLVARNRSFLGRTEDAKTFYTTLLHKEKSVGADWSESSRFTINKEMLK